MQKARQRRAFHVSNPRFEVETLSKQPGGAVCSRKANDSEPVICGRVGSEADWGVPWQTTPPPQSHCVRQLPLRGQDTTTGIEISYIPRNLITVIFYYQISLNPLKTLSLSQVSFPLDFPLCYIFPYGFTNSDKGKYKGKKIL